MTPRRTSAQRLSSNAALNVIGQAIQLLTALAVVPFLIRGLGSDAFGAFQLVWVVLGYLALVDIGLGRATTRFVADALGRNASSEVPEIVWSAGMLQAALGTLGAAVLVAISGLLTRNVLHVPPHLQGEVVAALRLMAVALPALLLAASFSGVIEAHQRFDLVNAVRVPSGIATLIAPLIALGLGARLVGLVGSVVLVRYLTAVAYYLVCRTMLVAEGSRGPSMKRLRTLMGFGGWVTVSNIISPLMVYLDRFMIGARFGLQAVAHYTAPFDAITRASIVPSSVTQALFPAFSALYASNEGPRASTIASGAVRVLAATMGPLAALVIIAAPTGLRIWLGSEFADAGSLPLQILVVGVLANALAQVPYAVLQGAGRADLTATFHLIELPAYALILWILAGRYGLPGAAAAWTLRCALDGALLFLAARRTLRAPLPLIRPLIFGAVLPIGVAVAIARVGLSGWTALAVAGIAAMGAAGLGWYQVLGPGERQAALRLTLGKTTIPSR
jgi:O-antigen/teichoic acid export membrane protein